MKTTIKILFQSMVACLILFAGCENMNDLHQKYLDEGETVYLGVADSLKVYPGYERIGLSWELNSDPRITGTIIYWNEGADSVVVNVNRTKPGAMLVDTIISLPEGFYQFEFITKDNYGHYSITAEISGSVYGERAKSLCSPRKVSGFAAYADDDAELYWGAVDSRSVKTTLKYKVSNGETIERDIPQDETKTLFSDFLLENDMFYATVTSFFLPVPNALDTVEVETRHSFDVNNMEITYSPLSKTGWVATSNGRPSYSTNISATIDNDHNTNWISEEAGDPRPLYLQIDMKTVNRVKSISVDERYDVRKAEIQTSVDGNDYTVIGSLSFSSGAHGIATLDLPKPVKARYLRIYVTESGNADGRGGFWEIDVTGN